MFQSEQVPEQCPGSESENAGKAASCSGCPNQNVCSSMSSSETVRLKTQRTMQQIKNRFGLVRNVLLVMSGKGGVGKSTCTALLARALAHRQFKVAVLDIDICGPSQPTLMGVRNEQVHSSGSGWSLVYVNDNLSVMSIGFLLENAASAVIWRSGKKDEMIKQFLSEVDWGELDYLIVDTPPGTSDEHLTSIKILLSYNLTGAIIVTTGQEVSLLDVRKQINFCRKLHMNVLGVIENMKDFVCPKCQFASEIFPARTGGARKMCSETNIRYLGSLSLDPKLTRLCDDGADLFEDYGNLSVIRELEVILNGLLLVIKEKEESANNRNDDKNQ